jgi:hypothetical protein
MIVNGFLLMVGAAAAVAVIYVLGWVFFIGLCIVGSRIEASPPQRRKD